ncbi:MAG TPA: glycosyl transferase [Alphaproteobacteria bacterium]|jgi:UDP-N-acetylmuramyl pentapeptide phosphotransferase/UDP-N-acetylglucosamine-1-phosphate transferase|nr:glycosyl transferase [Alphaproteobacteria bacterium]
MSHGLAALIAVLTALVSAGATAAVLRLLERRRILDHPNERSSHARATPRGGGIAVTGALVLAWAAVAALEPGASGALPWAVGGIVLLGVVSWRDDLRSLPALPRFAAQVVAVAAGLAAFDHGALVFQGLLPFWADRLLAALAWLWFVNLFNFMDGIDGLAGTETVAIGLGLALLALTAGESPATAALPLAAAAAALGFLPWNWQPARIFLGDVGSVPLGYALGWLLLAAAAAGHWAAALILPLYYLADATLTLLRRLLRGERVWRAHREHFYQRATRGGRSHCAVVGLIAGADALLIALALGAARWPWAMLAAAAVAVGLLLLVLARPRALPAR